VHTRSLWIRYPWILTGESNNGIRTLWIYFASLKYPTSFLAPLPGNGCCSNFEPRWSSYLFFFKIKKFLSFSSFLTSTLIHATLIIIVSFCFLCLYLHPVTHGRLSLYTPSDPLGWVSRAILSGPSSALGYEIHPSLIELVQENSFSRLKLWCSLSLSTRWGECFEQLRTSISKIRAFISSIPKILLKGTSPEQPESWGTSASYKSYPPDSFMVHSS